VQVYTTSTSFTNQGLYQANGKAEFTPC